jgi:hypothetical protein
MSAISFSFRPEAIPPNAQAEFLTRFCQLVLDYQTLIKPQQEAPAAESIPMPDFAPVEGDESAPVAPKKERKNPWAGLTEEQRTERLAAMKRGREIKKQEKRRLSEDSLTVAAPAPAPAPAPVLLTDPVPAPAAPVAEDAVSETSSKKARKNPWEGLSEEQKAERVAKMKAGKAAKKEAKLSV